MTDPAINNSGVMSVGGALVVGNGNTVESRSDSPPRAAESSELALLLLQIQRTALNTRLPSQVISELVGGVCDAQQSLSAGNLGQVGPGLLRGYTALSSADPENENVQLWQLMETAARLAFDLER